MDVKAAGSQATTKELDALRKENQGLKTQVMEVKAAGSQATTKELDALRKENQGLKKQVMQVKAAGSQSHDQGAGRSARAGEDARAK